MTRIVKFSTYKTAPNGGGACIDFKQYCKDNGLILYKSEPADREGMEYYLEIDRMPDPRPDFIVSAEKDFIHPSYAFTKYATIHKVQNPVNLELLRTVLDSIWKMANSNPDNVDVLIDLHHNPTWTGSKKFPGHWIEGNRRISLTIQEALPEEYFKDRFGKPTEINETT